MTDRLHERLDAKIGEVRAEGRVITAISACPADIERLFAEKGEAAILLDCDPNRDIAWYGDIELHPSPDAGTWLMIAGDATPIAV
jgi:hypothetical protein